MRGASEFLKAAIMQSHDYAKYLRISTNFGLMIAKQGEKMALISCNCHTLTKFFQCDMLKAFYSHVSAQNINQTILIVHKNYLLEGLGVIGATMDFYGRCCYRYSYSIKKKIVLPMRTCCDMGSLGESPVSYK